MKKCIECEHFKRVCPPMEHYDSGQALNNSKIKRIAYRLFSFFIKNSEK